MSLDPADTRTGRRTKAAAGILNAFPLRPSTQQNAPPDACILGAPPIPELPQAATTVGPTGFIRLDPTVIFSLIGASTARIQLTMAPERRAAWVSWVMLAWMSR
jgi:hypothetical protein